MTTNAHWTGRSIEDFVYRISSDFALQIETRMNDENITQSGLAEKIGVTPGRVSQVLRDPGNLTLKKMVEYARSLGMKVSVVAYDDGDRENENGPINSQIFSACWNEAGKPSDFFSLQKSSAVVIRTMPTIGYIGPGNLNFETSGSRLSVTNLVLDDMSSNNANFIFMGVQKEHGRSHSNIF